MPIQPQSNQAVSVSKSKFLFKVLLLGDSGVGKSSILMRYIDGCFNGGYLATIEIDFKVKTLECEGQAVKLQVWDTAGQEKFRTITKAYYRGCNGIFVIYDVTNSSSFANVENWVREARQQASKETRIILLGNKSDDESSRKVSYDIGYQVASSLGLSFFEVSAKDDLNLNEAFFEMTVQMKKVAEERVEMVDEIPVIKAQQINQQKPGISESKKSCC